MQKDHTLLEIQSFRSEYQKATSELVEVAGHVRASKSPLEHFEQQAYTWKEECRTLLLRSRDKDSKYEAEIASMKSDMTALVGDIIILRTRVYSGSNDDEALHVKMQSAGN